MAEGGGLHMQQIGYSHPHAGPRRSGVAKKDDTWLDPRSETSHVPCRAQGKRKMQTPRSKIVQNCKTTTESIKPSIGPF